MSNDVHFLARGVAPVSYTHLDVYKRQQQMLIDAVIELEQVG